MMIVFLILAYAATVLYCWTLDRKIKRVAQQISHMRGQYKALLTTIDCDTDKQIKRIEALENGLNPNYEAAKKATDELNNFNRGVAAILGYDPYEALHKDELKEE